MGSPRVHRVYICDRHINLVMCIDYRLNQTSRSEKKGRYGQLMISYCKRIEYFLREENDLLRELNKEQGDN